MEEEQEEEEEPGGNAGRQQLGTREGLDDHLVCLCSILLDP